MQFCKHHEPREVHANSNKKTIEEASPTCCNRRVLSPSDGEWDRKHRPIDDGDAMRITQLAFGLVVDRCMP